jgi:hypothetical protein
MLLSETEMARRIDFERNTLNRKSRYGLSIKDESEFRQHDLAARWLARAEGNKQNRKPLKQKPTRPKTARPPAASFEALDPRDPYHQLPNVDMTTPPWEGIK